MINQTKSLNMSLRQNANWKKLLGLVSSIAFSFIALFSLFALTNRQSVYAYVENNSDDHLLDNDHLKIATPPVENLSKLGHLNIKLKKVDTSLSNNVGETDLLVPTAAVIKQQAPNDLIVTGIVYVDDDRYSVASQLDVGDMTIPLATGINIGSGDEILIINMQGSDAGTHETAFVAAVGANDLTLTTPLTHDYDGAVDKIMIQRIPHYDDVIVEAGGELTAHAWDGETGGVVFLRANNVTVQAGGSITVSEKGYRPNEGPLSVTDPGQGRHGGYSFDEGLEPYGDPYRPIHLGSGGDDGDYGGSGGGVIYLDAANMITIDGMILSNGQATGYYPDSPGGGAGGSVWIEASISINGQGTIQANGNDGSDWDPGGPGGSGGRIAVYASIDNFSANGDLQAFGGNRTMYYNYGSAGTIYMNFAGHDTLLVDNDGNNGPLTGLPIGNYSFDTIQLTGSSHLEVEGPLLLVNDLIGDGSASLVGTDTMTMTAVTTIQDFVAITVMGDLLVSNSLAIQGTDLDVRGKLIGPTNIITIDNGGSLALYAGAFPSGKMELDEVHVTDGTLTLASYDNGNTYYGDDYGFTLEAKDIIVGLNGVVSADGLGYGSERGPGTPAYTNPDLYQAGAGHGGQGGQSSDGLIGGPTYGDALAPVDLGSGGGGIGGVGGGSIHLRASNTFVVDGIVSANAGYVYPRFTNSGGGSGGSIWIETPILNGSGTIRANGGWPGGVGIYGAGGGGGGGRIALYTSVNNSFINNGNLEVNGGSSYPVEYNGEDGTLIVDTIEAIYGLTAANDSPKDLGQDTTFTATVTAGDNASFAWDFGDDNNGGGDIVTHSYSEAGNYTAVVTASNSVSLLTATTYVTVNEILTDPDLAITKTGPSDVVAGALIIYDITIANNGDQPASNVIVTDTLPVSTTLVNSSHPYTLDSANNTVTWQFPFLQSDVNESISLELQVDVNAPSSITNQVISTIDEKESVSTNNQDEHTTTISPQPQGPDIAVTKMGPSNIPEGFPITYDISIVNQGGQIATGVMVTDTLPAGVTFISSTHESFNTIYHAGTREVVFAIGAMAPGQTNNIVLYADNTAPLGDIANHVTAALNESDADSLNNNDHLITTVIAAAPKLIVQPATSGSNHAILSVLQNGAPKSMVITITNEGTAPLVGGLTLEDIDTAWLNVTPLAFNDDIAIGESVTATLSVDNTDQAIGNYYDRITINSPNYEQLGFFLRLYVHPELTDIVAPITNDLDNDVPGAQVLLEKPINDHVFVVDGIAQPDTYYSQLSFADSNGDAHFSQLETGTYSYTVAAPGHETITGQKTIDPNQTQLVLPALRALPGLIFVPNQATLSVVAGEQSYFTLEVRNEGPGHAENFTVETPHDLPWISSGLPYGVTELLAGESMYVTLFMNPPANMENSRYQRYITVTADFVSDAILAATINVLVAETGSLEFSVVDGYGLPVAGAYVVATNEGGRTIIDDGVEELVYDTQSGATDANGSITFSELPQGEYAYHVDADGYYVESGSIEVSAGSVVAGENSNQVNVQLASDPFSYSWKVTETTIIDTYAYTVSITLDDPTKPSLFVSPVTFCPGDTRSFIISNGSAADIDNVVLIPDHNGVSFTVNGASAGGSYDIGTIAAGEAFTATIGTSASGTYDRYGQFNVSADYQTFAGSIPYHVSSATEAYCSESGGGGGEWTWVFDGNATIGTFTGPEIPSFPDDPPPASLPNDRDGVTLVLSGDATIERQAFNARLQMDSLTASVIENITINIWATDSSGNVVQGFAITPTIPTLLDDLYPESTVVGEWLMVPGDLGITDANGAVYDLKATIDYQMDGQSYTTETIPRQITVYPQPFVRLQFSTTQLDSNGDFRVEVVARNDGYGTARNLALDLSNVAVLPDLSGSNRSLSFDLKAAAIDGTAVNTEYIFNFGDLAPGAVSVGQWTINASDPNGGSLENMLITGFDVSCHHKPYQGLELSALIDCGATPQIFITPECPITDPDTCEEVGGPINTGNGNYTYRQRAPEIHAVGEPMQFIWTYNSLNTGISPELPVVASSLGAGWTHNHQLSLDFSGVASPDHAITMQAPHGTSLKFYVVRDEYRAAPGVLATLTRTEVFPNSYIYTVTTAVQTSYIFSETGQLLRQYDAQGNARIFTHNAAGQLEEVRDPVSNNYLSFTYLPNGQLERVTDPINRATEFGYNPLGLMTAVTNINGHAWQYEYTQHISGEYLLSKVIDPENRIVEHTEFDDFGRAISQTFKGGQLEIAYFDDGRRIITDGLQNDVMHIYDTQNALFAKRDALGEMETYVLDGNQNRVAVTDKLGHTTTATPTPLGYNPVITNAANVATYYEFDEFNNMLSTTDANAHTTTYDYDASHNLITETNALGEQTAHTYNEWGLRTSATSASGATTEYGYNLLGQMTVITNNIGLTTTYEYDIVGRLITTADTMGKVTVNEYDNGDKIFRTTSNYLAGQPQNYLDKYNIVTEYGYDKSGYQTVVTNTVGQVNLTLRDEYGRVVTSVANYDGVAPITSLCTDFTDPDPEYNICSLTGYNEIGQVVTSSNSLGVINVTEHDAAGRVIRTVRNWDDGIFNPNEPDRDIEQLTQYDAVGNTLIVTDTMGNMTRHFYNNLNQGVGSILNWSGSITRIEDLPTCFSLPLDRETDICALYAYDAVGNRTIVTDTVGQMSRTFYDELNRGWATVENWNPATLSSPADCVLSPDNRSAENICSLSGYDDKGRHITTTNALGQTSLTVYDELERPYLIVANWDGSPIPDVSSCTFPPVHSDTNLCSVTIYNEQGQRIASKNPMGRLTEYGYDDVGRVVTTTQYLADGTPVRSITTYGLMGSRTAQEDAEGYVTQFTYDSLFRLQSTVSSEGVAVTNTYNAAGQIVTVTNNLGHTTQRVYDDLGRLVKSIDGEDNATQYVYDALSNQVGVIDADNVRTTYIFDSLNRQVGLIANDTGGSQTVDGNVLTQYEYDVSGNLVHVINAENVIVSTRIYDELNRLVQETDALNHSAYYEYNALGNQVVITDANGAVTQYLYDGLNRVQSVQYLNEGATVTTAYDALGNATAITDSVGTTYTRYDNLSRPIIITDALGAVVAQTYDRVGNRAHITYPTGEVVTSTFDGDNRLLTVQAWDGGVTEYEYDSAGHMVTMTLPNGVVSTALYDQADRLTEIRHAAPGNILLGQYQYQLDGNGRAQIVTETLRSPDVAALNDAFLESGGLVVMEAENGAATAGGSHAWQPQTNQQGYGGDSYLRARPDTSALYPANDLTDSPHVAFPVQIANPDDYAIWVRGMAPDAGGDSLHVGLDGSVANGANFIGFAPNEWSWASATFSNSQTIFDLTTSAAYTLDLWMREDGLRVDRVLLITDTNYIPSGVGPAESQRETSGSGLASHVIGYEYDGLYRLTSAVVSGDLTASYGYAYDVLGNRMAYTATLTNTVVTTYTYDLANRLETARADDTNTIWHYVYDNNGNRLQQLPGSLMPTEGAIQYAYSQSNQLVRVETHDGSSFQLQAEMVYDGRGNRLQAIAHADGSSITAAYTLDPRSGLPLIVDNGVNVTMILYGQVAIGEYAVQTAAWAYYLGDAQLSVRQLVDESGTVTQAQTYGPYGVLLHQDGDGGGLFGYKGGQSSANGLWYFGDGYFDPQTGQFLSRNGNPLLPLAAAAMANPAGLLLGPVLLINWRRRKRKKGIHSGTLLLFGVLLAAGLSGCVPDPGPITVTLAPTPGEPGTPTPLPPPVVITPGTPNPTDDPDPIPPIPDCPTPSPTPSGTIYILFGGSPGDASLWGPDENNPSTDPQTPVWYELVEPEHFYQYPASKLDHARDAMGRGASSGKYAKYNLIIIGYSAGADSALLFAEMYYSYKEDNNTPGNIIGIALLGPTMTDDTGYLDGNWKRIMNDLLTTERGTKIYAINDNGSAGDMLEDYEGEPGSFASTYKYDLQDNRFCDDPDYNPEVDQILGEKCHGRDHWSKEHLTPGWATYGTNNDPDFSSRVIDWLTN